MHLIYVFISSDNKQISNKKIENVLGKCKKELLL